MDWHVLKIDGENVLSPRELADAANEQGFPADFWGRANSIHLPIGFEPGTAYLVVPRATMDAINADGLHTLTWQMSRDGTTTTTTFYNWVLCDSRIQGIDGDEKAAYLLTLRDARQILKHASLINQGYNVSVPTPCGSDVGSGGTFGCDKRYLPETLNSGSPWTWQEILADLWARLPAALGWSCPVLPWSPPHLPDSWRFHGIQVWQAIQMLMDACQTTVMPAAGGASWTCVNFGTAQATSWAALAPRLLRDEKPKDPCRCMLPESIRVTFPARLCDPCRWDTPSAWEDEPVYMSAAYATGQTCSENSSELGVRYDLIAEYVCDGTVANQVDLETAAAAIAARIATRMSVARDLAKDHSGICHEVTLGSGVHEIVYRDYGDDNGCITEAYGYQTWGLPREAWTKPVRDYPDCDRSIWVQAIDCLQLGQGGLVNVVRYSSADDAWVSDAEACADGTGTVQVCDPNCWLFALPGEVFRVTRDGCAGADCWLPESPYGLRRKIRIKSRLGCGETGTATVLDANPPIEEGSGSGTCEPSPAGCTSAWTESTCEITICNDGNRIIACDVPCEDAWAEAIPGTCIWLATPGQRATMATAVLTEEYCGDSPAEISSFQARDVCDWTPETMPDTAGADVKRLGCVGDTVLLYWDESNDECSWKVLSTPVHTFDHMFTKAECVDGCLKVYQTTGKVGVEQCTSCEAETPADIPTAMIEVVTGATVTYNEGSGSGCDPAGGNLSVNLTTSRVCVICPTGDGGESVEIGTPIPFPLELQAVEALVDVALECDPCIGLTPTVKTFYAFCVAESEALSSEFCTCYECPTESGSGS